MAAIANELDKLLAANPAPPEVALNRTILIATSSPGGFKIASNGTALPASIELAAVLVNVQGTVAWSASSGVTLAIDGNAATLDAVDMIAESATITATLTYNGTPYERTIVVNKVRDGANGNSAEAPDLSAPALLDTLTNQITESQLYSALRTRITLIDAAPTVPGSVGARILTEENARKDAVAAEASARQVALANFDTNIRSYVQTYAYSKSTNDEAMSSLASQLRSEFSSNNGASVAWVQEYAYSKAQANSAIATATQDLRTTVGNHTSTLQVQGQSINGLGAQYTVKIDNNGYVTGYGLASEVVNGTPKSSFIVMADKFAVVAPGMTPKTMFIVGNVGGQAAIGINGNTVIDGTLQARSMIAETITSRELAARSVLARHILVSGDQNNLVRDPQFKDMAWWGFAGSALQGISFGRWADAGMNTRWKHGVSMYMGPTNTYNELVAAYSQTMPLVPGATYRAEYQVGFSNDFDGDLTIWLHVYNSNLNFLGPFLPGGGVPDSGFFFNGNAPAIQYPNTSRGGRDIDKLFTLDANNRAIAGCQFVIIRQVRAGTCEIGGFTLTRVTDETLIGPGVVQTKHLSISKGGDISSGQTAFDQGVGFWIEGAGNGHGARMSLGTSGGPRMVVDPNNNRFEFIGPQITNPQYAPFSVSIGGDVDGGGSGKAITVGVRTAAITGESNFKSIQWVIESTNGSGGLSLLNATTRTVTVRSNVGTTPANNTGRLTVTVVGLDGRSVTDSVDVYAEHV